MIGLTGAVGSGKSTAARHFEAAGCRVIDVDRLGHEALESVEVRAALQREFGAAAFRADGSVDRAAVAQAAFGDRARLRRLEEAVHPVVRRQVESLLGTARAARPRAIVIDCALLFEGRLEGICDVTVAVQAARDVRLARLRAARGWSEGEVAGREAAQLPAEEKVSRADHVLPNDGDDAALRRSAEALLEALAPRATGGVRHGRASAPSRERNER